MKITTHRIKQYNSTYKTVVCVDDKPVCIVSGTGKTLSNVIAYLNGYDVPISDGKIKIALDRYRAENKGKYINFAEELKDVFEFESESNKNICDSCTAKRCMYQSAITIKHCDFYKSGK